MPRGHAEVTRLEAEAAPAGGLRVDSFVVLANGDGALVRRIDDETVRAAACTPRRAAPLRHRRACLTPFFCQVVLDCNHPLAGAPLKFTLTLKALEKAA